MMYKIISAVLALGLIAFGVVFTFEKCSNQKERARLKRQLAKMQTLQKETESSFSIMASETEGLQTKNKELQQIIESRDEEILALSEVNIQLKDKIVEFGEKDVNQVVVDNDNPDVVVEDEQPDECKDIRYRVDFQKEEDPLKIEGYTLTNPPYAKLQIRWVNDLKLDLFLTKDQDGFFRVYLDSKSIVPTKLNLQVDPSILSYKWYQKISFGSAVQFGETGVIFSLHGAYDVLPNLYIGPLFSVGYVGKNAETFYGVVVGWRPWL